MNRFSGTMHCCGTLVALLPPCSAPPTAHSYTWFCHAGAGGSSTTTPRKLRQMRSSAATPSTPPTPAKQNITEITPQRLTERLEQQLNALATKAQVRVGLAQSVAAVTASVREVLRRWQQSTNLALHGVSCLEDELAHQLLTIRKQGVQLKQRVRACVEGCECSLGVCRSRCHGSPAGRNDPELEA